MAENVKKIVHIDAGDSFYSKDNIESATSSEYEYEHYWKDSKSILGDTVNIDEEKSIENATGINADILIVYERINVLSLIEQVFRKENVEFVYATDGILHDKKSMQKWENLIYSTNNEINVIVPSGLYVSSYPDLGQNVVNTHFAPVYPVDKEKISEHKDSSQKEYEICYYNDLSDTSKLMNMIDVINNFVRTNKNTNLTVNFLHFSRLNRDVNLNKKEIEDTLRRELNHTVTSIVSIMPDFEQELEELSKSKLVVEPNISKKSPCYRNIRITNSVCTPLVAPLFGGVADIASPGKFYEVNTRSYVTDTEPQEYVHRDDVVVSQSGSDYKVSEYYQHPHYLTSLLYKKLQLTDGGFDFNGLDNTDCRNEDMLYADRTIDVYDTILEENSSTNEDETTTTRLSFESDIDYLIPDSPNKVLLQPSSTNTDIDSTHSILHCIKKGNTSIKKLVQQKERNNLYENNDIACISDVSNISDLDLSSETYDSVIYYDIDFIGMGEINRYVNSDTTEYYAPNTNKFDSLEQLCSSLNNIDQYREKELFVINNLINKQMVSDNDIIQICDGCVFDGSTEKAFEQRVKSSSFQNESNNRLAGSFTITALCNDIDIESINKKINTVIDEYELEKNDIILNLISFEGSHTKKQVLTNSDDISVDVTHSEIKMGYDLHKNIYNTNLYATNYNQDSRIINKMISISEQYNVIISCPQSMKNSDSNNHPDYFEQDVLKNNELNSNTDESDISVENTHSTPPVQDIPSYEQKPKSLPIDQKTSITNIYTDNTPIDYFKPYMSQSAHNHQLINKSEFSSAAEFDRAVCNTESDIVLVHIGNEFYKDIFSIFSTRLHWINNKKVVLLPYTHPTCYLDIRVWFEKVMRNSHLSGIDVILPYEERHNIYSLREITSNINGTTINNIYSGPELGFNIQNTIEKYYSYRKKNHLHNIEGNYDILCPCEFTKNEDIHLMCDIINKASEDISREISVCVAERENIIGQKDNNGKVKLIDELLNDTGIDFTYVDCQNEQEYINVAAQSKTVVFPNTKVNELFNRSFSESLLLNCNVIAADWGFKKKYWNSDSVKLVPVRKSENDTRTKTKKEILTNTEVNNTKRNTTDLLSPYTVSKHEFASEIVKSLNTEYGSNSEINKVDHSNGEMFIDNIISHVSNGYVNNSEEIDYVHYSKCEKISVTDALSFKYLVGNVENKDEFAKREVESNTIPLNDKQINKYSKYTELESFDESEKEYNVLHVTLTDSTPGGLERTMEKYFDRINHYKMKINYSITELSLYKNYMNKFDLVAAHRGRDEEMHNIANMMDSTTKFAYIPHANNTNTDKRNTWKTVVSKLNETSEMNIISSTKRAAPLFPNKERKNIKFYHAPTTGLDPRKLRKAKERLTPNELATKNEHISPYDVMYFGRLNPQKTPHRVLDIVRDVSENIDRKISVCIAGFYSTHRGEKYWKNICKPMIKELRDEFDVEVNYKGFVSDLELYKSILNSKVILFPMTMGRENWCESAWQAVSLGATVLGADWSGCGDAMIRENNYRIPVSRVDNEVILKDPVSDDYEDRSLDNIVGYNINKKYAVNKITELLDKPLSELNIPIGAPQFTCESEFNNTLIRIINDEDPDVSPENIPKEFPEYYDCLYSNFEH